MDRLRTLAGVLVSLLVVAWLVRVPVTEQDYRPVPTEVPANPDPTPTPTPIVSPTDVPEATAGATRFTVQPVDPVTLLPLTESPVATIGTWLPGIAGSDQLLVETRIGTEGRFDRVRRLNPPSLPGMWPSDPLEPESLRTWVGGTDDTTAWALADGRVRIRRPGSSGAHRTMFLPDARRVADAAFLGDGLLAMRMTQGQGVAPSVLLVDVGAATLIADVTLDLPAEDVLQSAWDVAHRRLYLLDGDAGLLVAIQLDRLAEQARTSLDPRADLDGAVSLQFGPPVTGQQEMRTVDLVADLGLPPTDRGFGLSAGGGLVVVHSLAVGHSSDGHALHRAIGGLVLLDAELNLLHRRDELSVESALVSAASDRVLVAVRDGGLHVLDGALVNVGDVLMHGPTFVPLGARGDQAYVLMRSGSASREWLASVDLEAGKISAMIRVGTMQTFLPAAAVLISPA